MALVEIQIRSGFYRTGDQLGASHFCSDGLRGLFIAPGGPLGVTDRQINRSSWRCHESQSSRSRCHSAGHTSYCRHPRYTPDTSPQLEEKQSLACGSFKSPVAEPHVDVSVPKLGTVERILPLSGSVLLVHGL